jgi:hypothetical protein
LVRFIRLGHLAMTIDLSEAVEELLYWFDNANHGIECPALEARLLPLRSDARPSSAQDTYRADIIEAAAEAIATYGTTHFGDATPYAEQSMGAKAIRRGEARAALSFFTAALRSEGAVEAGARAISSCIAARVERENKGLVTPEEIYARYSIEHTEEARAAIDAAIKSVGGGE